MNKLFKAINMQWERVEPHLMMKEKVTFKNATYTLSQTFKTKLKNYHSVIIHLTNEYDNY